MHQSAPRRAIASPRRPRWRSVAAVLVSLACTLALVAGFPAGNATAAVGVFSASVKPKTSAISSARAVNLGVKFSPTKNGVITGLQFYRSKHQKRAYVATLWSASGKVLARGTFARSSRKGWQTVKFSKPVPVKRGTTYVASYLASNGRFAVTRGGFSKKVSRNGITIPRNGGVFKYSKKSKLPKSSSRSSNYLVDVIFEPTVATPSPSPTPTVTRTPSPSPTPTVTRTPSPSPTPTVTKAPSPSPTPTVTRTPSPSPTPTTTAPVPSGALTATEARTAASRRVFFGHQSVGGNVLRGIGDTFDAFGINEPPDPELTNGSTSGLPASGPVLADAYVGVNQEPMGKLRAFEAYLRAGVGASVDVALIKFCYADIRNLPGSDYESVDELFNAYSAMMSRLERDFPNVRFIYATAPVENAEMKSSAVAAYNANRARYNALVRARYGNSGWLWDVAKAESTAPDGSRVTTSYSGQTHEALYAGYSTDGGHLNENGRRVLAAPLLRLIARA